jgi:AraC-like DNA-binding protein
MFVSFGVMRVDRLFGYIGTRSTRVTRNDTNINFSHESKLVSHMHYREFKSSPQLAPYVECFWTLESDDETLDRVRLATSDNVQPERILPDGCVELILNFGAQFREQKEDGHQERQPMYFLVGQMTRPMLISPEGRVELVGVRFHPGGTLPFFRVDMQDLTNRVVELAALSRAREKGFVARLDEALSLPSLTLKIGMLEKLLTSQLSDAKHDSRLIRLAAGIVARGGQVTVDELARDAGVSGRQLERRFLSQVGIGPKLLARILRFQQVFRAVERDDSGWAAVAADCGYYDQAHLIRDFQQFARQTPAALFAQPTGLTQSFTRKDRTSDFSNTLT